MSTVYILKGVSCGGKSTVAKKLEKEKDAIIMSSDDAREIIGLKDMRNTPEVFSIMEAKIVHCLQNGQSVIVDYTNLTPRKTARWINVARQYKARTVCYFINPDDEKLKENIKERVAKRWSCYTAEEVWDIVSTMKRLLQVPTLADGFDDIEIINISRCKNQYSKEFTNEFLRSITEAPTLAMHNLLDNGILKEVFPEWLPCVGLNQENKNHSLNVFDHLLKSAESFSVRETTLILTMLLHDIGKGYTGIKSYMAVLKENYRDLQKGIPLPVEIIDGNVYCKGILLPENIIRCDREYHFYNHENLSAQLSCHILERLGLDKPTTLKILSLIQLHMHLPFDFDPFNAEENGRLSKYKHKFRYFFNDLVEIRKADILGK